MTYFSGFTTIHHDSQETKLWRDENDTKAVNSRVLSPVSMGLILVFTQFFWSKLLLGSLKLRYTTLLS